MIVENLMIEYEDYRDSGYGEDTHNNYYEHIVEDGYHFYINKNILYGYVD